jgi:hypothetical protein
MRRDAGPTRSCDIVRAVLLAGVAWLSCGSTADAQELPEPARYKRFWFGWDTLEFEREFQEHNRVFRGFERVDSKVLTFSPPPYTWVSGTRMPPLGRLVDAWPPLGQTGDFWMPGEYGKVFRP